MKRFIAFAALTALAIGMGAGAASAQKVADLGFAGMDPKSGKAPKQVVIFFHGYTQRGVAMKPLADTLAKRLPDAAFIFNDGPLTQGDGKSWYVLLGEDPQNTKGAVKKLAARGLVLADDVRDFGVAIVEDLAQQKHSALGRRKLLQQHQKRHRQRL